MNCMQNEELPVKIAASLALSSLLQYESGILFVLFINELLIIIFIIYIN